MQEDVFQDETEQMSEEEIAHNRKMEVFAALGQTLAQKKDKCVDHKSDVETRWLRDERQYWGVHWGTNEDIDHTAGKVDHLEKYQVTDRKTAQKTRTIAARIGDMLFPTNDKNWAMKATKEPTDIDGNEIPDDEAEDAAQAVEDKIDDYLGECNYSKSGRKAIFDGCRIGTGVLKGPFSKGVTRRRVTRQAVPVMDAFGQPAIDEMGNPITELGPIELTVAVETRPAVARVDPWMWFPAPSRNIEECEFSFELHLKTKDGLRDMAKYPGFEEDQIRKLLEKEPDQGRERALLSQRRDLLRTNNESLDNTYTVWEYHGPIDKEDLLAIGIEIDDPMESVFGEVWFCQGIVLKVELSAVVDDHRVPYYVWCYEEDEADIFGYGIPYIMRDEQSVLDSTLNAMIHNSNLTSGPQSIEFGPNKVKPADGNRQINGPKHWIAEDPDMTDFREAIQFHYIEPSIGNIMPIYELASRNADQNTMLPMIAQGEATNAVPTSSGMAMLMNASNIVQRMAAHSWDDNITIPMITRFYYWLMQYDEDDGIKMDMNVDARGASYLLVKDMQAQHGMMLLQMAGQDPELRNELDMSETYRTVVSFLDVPTDRLFKTDEQKQQDAQGMQAQQQAQQRLQEAEIAKLEAEAMKAQAEAQSAGQGDGGFEAQKAQLEYQQHMADLEARMMIAQMERDGKLAAAAADKDVKLAELQANLQTKEKDLALKQYIESLKLAQKAQEGERREYTDGMKTRLQMEKLQQKQQNLAQGFDTYG